jgi:hypothetical protein
MLYSIYNMEEKLEPVPEKPPPEPVKPPPKKKIRTRHFKVTHIM